MKPFNIKASIFVICAALLTLFAPHQTSAQELFKGVVTYKMSMNGASATTCTVYYRGHDYMTIPVVILFENGKELRRITSAAYSEEDILKFVEGR